MKKNLIYLIIFFIFLVSKAYASYKEEIIIILLKLIIYPLILNKPSKKTMKILEMWKLKKKLEIVLLNIQSLFIVYMMEKREK